MEFTTGTATSDTNAMIIGRNNEENLFACGRDYRLGHSPPMHSAPVCGAAGGNDLQFIVARASNHGGCVGRAEVISELTLRQALWSTISDSRSA
jgi:hypothetical protein